MPDKLTDNDIKKALECCVNNTDKDCHKCPFSECDRSCVDELELNALDYINLLEARIDIYETCNARKDEAIKHLEVEKERLKKENKLLIDNDVSNKYPNCVLVEKGRIYTRTLEDYDELIGDISAEAVKEFAERLKAEFLNDEQIVNMAWVNAINHIDNILKELVGEDNG